MRACKESNFDKVKELFENPSSLTQVNVRHKNADGNTVFHICAMWNKNTIADINAYDRLQVRREHIIEILLNHVTNIETALTDTNNANETPMQLLNSNYDNYEYFNDVIMKKFPEFLQRFEELTYETRYGKRVLESSSSTGMRIKRRKLKLCALLRL